MKVSLYVGDLHPEVTETDLLTKFTTVGPISTVRICRDYARSPKSLVYAYINYVFDHDAERALDTLNHTKVLGYPCRISWSQRDKDSRRKRKSGEGNIFISNLAEEINNELLLDIFSVFGNVVSCKVDCDPETGKRSGQGYVQYTSEKSAKDAIRAMNGQIITGKAVKVKKWWSKHERDEWNKENFVSVYIKNIPKYWTEERLMDLASEFGDYNDCIIQKDENGKSREFGFINFKKSADAKMAVEGLHNREINGKEGKTLKLYASRAQSKGERKRILKKKWPLQEEDYFGRNLYVKGLLDIVDEEQLRSAFSKFGKIKSCRVMREKNGVSKGFGFVHFTSEKAVEKAITAYNSKKVEGLGKGPLRVDFASKSKPRDRMKNNSIYLEGGQMIGHWRGQIWPFGPCLIMPPKGYLGIPAGGLYPPMCERWPYKQDRQYHPKGKSVMDCKLKETMSLPLEEQKQMFREKIFAIVKRMRIKEAGKITGLLLEMESETLMDLLRQPNLLYKKILQASDSLKLYQQRSSEKGVE